jgi:Tfp pilus assembly PilM family ATPase
MTRSIASSLSLPILQAEEYKRSYGVRADVLEGKLFQAVGPITTNLTNEIKKAYSFITQNNLTSKPTRVVLTGGGALIPGLLELISKSTGLEATLGSPDLVTNGQVFNSLYLASVGASHR